MPQLFAFLRAINAGPGRVVRMNVLRQAFESFENSEVHGADANIIFLADNLDERSKAKLVALKTGTDGFCVHGREIYWWRRKKPGTSLFSTVPLAELLRVPFTIRSTDTIRKLVATWP